MDRTKLSQMTTLLDYVQLQHTTLLVIVETPFKEANPFCFYVFYFIDFFTCKCISASSSNLCCSHAYITASTNQNEGQSSGGCFSHSSSSEVGILYIQYVMLFI